MKNIDVTDELLYKYMPIADEKAMAALEEQLDDEEIILSSKFEKRMKRLMWREKHKWVVEFGKFIIKVAVVCLCILGVSFAVTMSVDAYRSKFFQTVQELLGDAAVHTYDANEDSQGFVPHEPTYIPEGYVEVNRVSTQKELCIEYSNGKEGYFCWDQTYIKEGTWNALDTDYETQDIKMLQDGILIVNYYKDNYISAYYEKEEYVYMITAVNLSDEEVVNIFKSFE